MNSPLNSEIQKQFTPFHFPASDQEEHLPIPNLV